MLSTNFTHNVKSKHFLSIAWTKNELKKCSPDFTELLAKIKFV